MTIEKMAGTKLRNWVFTLNANEALGEHIMWVTPGAECPVAAWFKEPVTYLACQVEQVAHVHVQGYIEFSKPMRVAALKKFSDRAHWEPRRGTQEQARDYAMKADTRFNGPWEFGTLAKQGKRTDLEAIGALVKARKTNVEILEELGPTTARFSKQITFLRFTYAEGDSDRQLTGVRVIVLYGETNTGKTYAAINYLSGGKDYYICEAPSHKDSKVWFDGYEGQGNLILDDFAGSFCCFRFLLRLLDCYKLKVEIKGGHTWAAWHNVYITTNVHPSEWYPAEINSAPLKRRINEIRFVEHQGTYKLQDWEHRSLSQDFEIFEAVQPDHNTPPATPMDGLVTDDDVIRLN